MDKYKPMSEIALKRYYQKFYEKNNGRGTLNNLSDANLGRTFAGCVIPLRKIHYTQFREYVETL